MKNITLIFSILVLFVIFLNHSFVIKVSPDDEIYSHSAENICTTSSSSSDSEDILHNSSAEEPAKISRKLIFTETNSETTNNIQTKQQTKTEQAPKTKTRSTNTDILPADCYGRLCIEDKNISVLLYEGVAQAIVDRANSAAIFDYPPFKGKIIADHNYQEFANLKLVTVGTVGHIERKKHKNITIKCIEVIDGHNARYNLVDKNHKTIPDADYITYTCMKNSYNIRICRWEIFE